MMTCVDEEMRTVLLFTHTEFTSVLPWTSLKVWQFCVERAEVGKKLQQSTERCDLWFSPGHLKHISLCTSLAQTEITHQLQKAFPLLPTDGLD